MAAATPSRPMLLVVPSDEVLSLAEELRGLGGDDVALAECTPIQLNDRASMEDVAAWLAEGLNATVPLDPTNLSSLPPFLEGLVERLLSNYQLGLSWILVGPSRALDGLGQHVGPLARAGGVATATVTSTAELHTLLRLALAEPPQDRIITLKLYQSDTTTLAAFNAVIAPMLPSNSSNSLSPHPRMHALRELLTEVATLHSRRRAGEHILSTARLSLLNQFAAPLVAGNTRLFIPTNENLGGAETTVARLNDSLMDLTRNIRAVCTKVSVPGSSLRWISTNEFVTRFAEASSKSQHHHKGERMGGSVGGTSGRSASTTSASASQLSFSDRKRQQQRLRASVSLQAAAARAVSSEKLRRSSGHIPRVESKALSSMGPRVAEVMDRLPSNAEHQSARETISAEECSASVPRLALPPNAFRRHNEAIGALDDDEIIIDQPTDDTPHEPTNAHCAASLQGPSPPLCTLHEADTLRRSNAAHPPASDTAPPKGADAFRAHEGAVEPHAVESNTTTTRELRESQSHSTAQPVTTATRVSNGTSPSAVVEFGSPDVVPDTLFGDGNPFDRVSVSMPSAPPPPPPEDSYSAAYACVRDKERGHVPTASSASGHGDAAAAQVLLGASTNWKTPAPAIWAVRSLDADRNVDHRDSGDVFSMMGLPDEGFRNDVGAPVQNALAMHANDEVQYEVQGPATSTMHGSTAEEMRDESSKSSNRDRYEGGSAYPLPSSTGQELTFQMSANDVRHATWQHDDDTYDVSKRDKEDAVVAQLQEERQRTAALQARVNEMEHRAYVAEALLDATSAANRDSAGLQALAESEPTDFDGLLSALRSERRRARHLERQKQDEVQLRLAAEVQLLQAQKDEAVAASRCRAMTASLDGRLPVSGAFERYEAIVSAAQRECRRLRRENSDLSSVVAHLQVEAMLANAALERRAVSEDVTAVVADLHRRLQEAQSQVKKLQAENEAKQGQLEAAEKRLRRADVNKRAAQEAFNREAELRTKLCDADMQVEAQCLAAAEAMGAVERLARERDALNSALEAMEGESASLRELVDALRPGPFCPSLRCVSESKA